MIVVVKKYIFSLFNFKPKFIFLKPFTNPNEFLTKAKNVFIFDWEEEINIMWYKTFEILLTHFSPVSHFYTP